MYENSYLMLLNSDAVIIVNRDKVGGLLLH
jgi:hypothetical protein